MATPYESTDMDLSKSPRRTPTPPPLPPCEQLQLNKAQLSKMITFRKHQLACIQELQAMPPRRSLLRSSCCRITRN
ncbi:hypothetical protein TNCT_539091 [Trichonephila clavata]|uniref:Uncharacterized protein n=1 Tax=Trichonephila clavata TaxID=2740835 RepID=A0A8X6I1M0_TRICU|nr:hypothetical protein TNCT_539091 [Trichonephila clavata]